MEVFLFPLVNVSLFPKTTKPLRIFEPRYLEMVRVASARKTPIAIGFIEDVSLVAPVTVGQPVAYVNPVAGYGMVQIVEERLDGTMLVFIQGQGKVRLGNVVDRQTTYMVVEAEVIEEITEVEPDNEVRLDQLLQTLKRWIHTHIPDKEQQNIFNGSLSGPEEIVGAFASYLVRDYDFQEHTMEFTNINDSIRYLHRLMASSQLTT